MIGLCSCSYWFTGLWFETAVTDHKNTRKHQAPLQSSGHYRFFSLRIQSGGLKGLQGWGLRSKKVVELPQCSDSTQKKPSKDSKALLRKMTFPSTATSATTTSTAAASTAAATATPTANNEKNNTKNIRTLSLLLQEFNPLFRLLGTEPNWILPDIVTFCLLYHAVSLLNDCTVKVYAHVSFDIGRCCRKCRSNGQRSVEIPATIEGLRVKLLRHVHDPFFHRFGTASVFCKPSPVLPHMDYAMDSDKILLWRSWSVYKSLDKKHCFNWKHSQPTIISYHLSILVNCHLDQQRTANGSVWKLEEYQVRLTIPERNDDLRWRSNQTAWCPTWKSGEKQKKNMTNNEEQRYHWTTYQ